jgi:hypothetical protein
MIDDVYDLTVGQVCRDYNTNEPVGKIEFVFAHSSEIIFPTIQVNGEHYFRNGFEFYDSHKINGYMIKAPTNQWWPRIKI